MAYKRSVMVNQRGESMDKHLFELEIEKIAEANKKYEKERQKKIRKTLRWAKWKRILLKLTKGV